MQSETAFVWAESRVELHPVAAVDLDLILVIFPDDAELDDALRDGDDLEGDLVFRVLFEEGAVFKGGDQLCVVPLSALSVSVARDKDSSGVVW